MKTSFSPLQLLSPVQLIFCLVLFFLPWIELQCALPPDAMKDAPKEVIEGMKKDGLDPNRPISMASQSGLQIATGGSSPGSDMEKFTKSIGKGMGGMGGMNPEPKTSPKKNKDDDVNGAPLLFLFPVALVAGIGLGCVPFQHLGRRLALAGCCLGAFGVVGLQAAIGFPLEKEIAKQKEQFKAFGGGGGGFGGGGFGGAAPDPKGGKVSSKEPEIFRVSWKIPLYLTFLLLLGATATAFLDGSLLGGTQKSKRRYRDDDDEDEDDEDDRPRKKKRRDEDDEEEERPKKKAKAPIVEDLPEDDDEPAPAKKKPRRRDDDDEEDDRPRKKKPRRDDD